MKREEIIGNYFRAWIENDIEPLKDIFSEDIVYSECYGPEYHGLTQILRWFADWQKRGTVIKWEIKRFIHHGTFTAAEWYFEYEYDGKADRFDGVSLIEFNDEDRITLVKEFRSEADHIFPYENSKFGEE